MACQVVRFESGGSYRSPNAETEECAHDVGDETSSNTGAAAVGRGDGSSRREGPEKYDRMLLRILVTSEGKRNPCE